MAALNFSLWFILKITLVTGQSTVYILKGRDLILTPDLMKPPDDILWKHNGDKVISFDGAEERVFEPYRGRVTLAWDTAKLTISDVRYEDSGEYELDIISDERLSRSQYLLKVLDQVSKPVIRCEMNDKNSNSNITSATLFCSSPSNTPEALTFVWTLEGKSEPGQTLPIELGNGHDGITYRCTANNLLQEETSTFMATDCYTERTQNIVVPIVIVTVILLVFCIVAITFRHRIKRVCLNMRKNDDCEEQKAADSSPVQKQDESDQITFESEPLIASKIHQEETKSSSQRFILQQCDNENVIEESPGNVKDLLKKFESTETSPGKGHDTGGKATSPPTSVSSRVRKPTPGPGQMDSGGEMDLQHEELHNVSTTEEDGDTDSKHSDEDEYEYVAETQEEQGSSVQTENEHHKDDQHNQNNSTKDDGQPTNEEKTELNTVTNPECTVNIKPPKHPTDASFSPGNVSVKCKEFGNRGKATSPPTSVSSRVRKPTPGPGQMDSGGEMDLQHEELHNVSTTEEEGDTDSKHSDEDEYKDAPESPEEQGSSVQTENEHHKDDDQHNQNNSTKDDGQPTNEEKTELNTVTNPECTVNIKPPKHPTDAPFSPGNVSVKCKEFENRGKATSPPTSVSSRVRKPTPGPGQMDSGGEMDLQHEELHNVSTTEEEADTDSKHCDEDEYEDAPESDEPGGTEQTNLSADLDTDQVKTGPLSNNPSTHEEKLNDSQIFTSSPEFPQLPSQNSELLNQLDLGPVLMQSQTQKPRTMIHRMTPPKKTVQCHSHSLHNLIQLNLRRKRRTMMKNQTQSVWKLYRETQRKVVGPQMIKEQKKHHNFKMNQQKLSVLTPLQIQNQDQIRLMSPQPYKPPLPSE